MVSVVLLTMNSYRVACQRAAMTLVHGCGPTVAQLNTAKTKVVWFASVRQ